jgi:putative transposase
MCKLFKVSRSCYYNWIEKGCIVNRVDVEFNNLIKNVFEQARATYGTRRLKEILKQRYGLIVSRRKIQKSLKQLNLKVKMKWRFKVITTTSNHTLPIAPNYVNRDFYSSSTDKVYVGDITYIPTKEGWLYLAVVIVLVPAGLHDIYSRKVVGWSMRYSLHTSLVNDALLMAIKRRNPNKGLIYHTDRGSQYASYEHKNLLEKYGIIQSMWKSLKNANCFAFLDSEP